MRASADFSLSGGVQRRALISNCGRYRYRLVRQWGHGPYVLWIMLNPSTADAYQDDRTIGRVCDFSHRWGYGGALVGNLYALRATDPRELRKAEDPAGINNMWHIAEMAKLSEIIVCAWGQDPVIDPAYSRLVVSDLGRPLKCLGLTRSGAPKHPLYLPGDSALREYAP